MLLQNSQRLFIIIFNKLIEITEKIIFIFRYSFLYKMYAYKDCICNQIKYKYIVIYT